MFILIHHLPFPLSFFLYAAAAFLLVFLSSLTRVMRCVEGYNSNRRINKNRAHTTKPNASVRYYYYYDYYYYYY